MKTNEFIAKIESGACDERILDIYVDENKVAYQKQRYIEALKQYETIFGEDEVEIYSAPGRSEVGGNHTDHQHGEVLAASINLDAIAVVKPLGEAVVKLVSEGYEMITVDLNHLEYDEREKESTCSLIKGVLYKMQSCGYQIGGFQAYVTSDVLIGAGLSSSAAFETLIGTVISGLFNEMKVDPVTIAMIGQYAENEYFGKPCGLMDQTACSVGNLVHINFADTQNPIIEQVAFDMNKHGYSLCITDTKGSHADLTADYAAVPSEMKQVAAFFGQEYLLGLTVEDILAKVAELREQLGDRAVLRALHFIRENERVQKEVRALSAEDIDTFLKNVAASGNSSYKYLQNVYSNSDVTNQNISVALAFSEDFLGDNGVCRVHGGGFAGTIQAFVKNEVVADYQKRMDAIFGNGSCSVLKIRKYGGIKVM
ncbi:galactokinase [Agathobacter ruminis]|uniref:Galactokinase n=1 Tax=Agathobacter ruminis TaxID=1712665 RepID=A0A2G3E3M7_9FIRM|nr:galactokinase family protein [Agathobacter ruminis]MDC7300255.1 galactokinase [Agathobacter ruminis]PHU37878.1 galactokinase [Agathobacter ruminis]